MRAHRAWFGVLLVVGVWASAGCAGALSGQQGAASAPPEPAGPLLRATVVPAEVDLAGDRLYATVWLNRADDLPTEVFLRGPGAPSRPFVVPPGREACEGIRIGIGQTGSIENIGRNEACSFRLDVSRVEAGAFTIEMIHAGRRIGRHAFSLVELPASGATRRLAVDPASRLGAAYFHPTGFVFWLPVDARYESRTVAVVWFRGDAHSRTDTDDVRGPALSVGAPVVAVRPVWVGPPPDGSGEWRVAAFADGRPLGSWRYEVDSDGTFGGYPVLRRDRLGPLRAEALPPQLAEIASREVEPLARSSQLRQEPRVCAVVESREAAEAAQRLSISPATAATRQLDRLASHYGEGCFEQVMSTLSFHLP